MGIGTDLVERGILSETDLHDAVTSSPEPANAWTRSSCGWATSSRV